MKLNFVYKAVIVCCTLFMSTADTYAQSKTEYEVKALYLVSLLKYITFSDKEQVFKIGVIGDNPFNGHLRKFDGKKLQGRQVKILFFNNNTDLALKEKCHFLFIANSEVLKQKALIQKLDKPNNVILGDNKWFMNSGGLINFQFLGDKVRWETNKALLDRKKIKVDYQIYQLSTNRGEVK